MQLDDLTLTNIHVHCPNNKTSQYEMSLIGTYCECKISVNPSSPIRIHGMFEFEDN